MFGRNCGTTPSRMPLATKAQGNCSRTPRANNSNAPRNITVQMVSDDCVEA